MAKAQRKALARLERRQKSFDDDTKGKVIAGWKRPGSLNRKK